MRARLPLWARLPLLLFGITALLFVALLVVLFFVRGRGVFPESAGLAALLGAGVAVFAGLGVASFFVLPLVRLKSITVPLLLIFMGVSFFYSAPSIEICRILLRSAFEQYQLVCFEDLALAGIVMVIFGGFVFFRVLAVLRGEKAGREEELGGDDDSICVYCISGGDRGRRLVGAGSGRKCLDAGFGAFKLIFSPLVKASSMGTVITPQRL